MRPTNTVALVSVVLACLWSGACAHRRKQEPRPVEVTAPAPADQVEVVPLRFAVADQLAAVLRNTLGTPQLRIQADARTNSVLLAGPAPEVERAKRVIAQLDVEVREQP